MKNMRIFYSTELKKFGKQGEKTGWTYIHIPKIIAEKLKPGTKRSFRVKGNINEHPINSVALIPMGGGDFIIAVNAEMRKSIRKMKGAKVKVMLEEDNSAFIMSEGLMYCLKDDPEAMEYFNSLLPSHQRYFSKWIDSAKTEPTITKRIAITLNAMANRLTFSEMLRLQSKTNKLIG